MIAKARAEEERLEKEEADKERAEEEERQKKLAVENAEKNKKKHDKKAKIEELKAQGKYMSKKDFEKKKAAEARMAALGIVPPKDDEAEGEAAADGDQKKSQVVGRKRKDKKTKEAEKEAQAAAEADEKTAEAQAAETAASKPKEVTAAAKETVKPAAAAAEPSDDDDDDDWEAAVDKVEVKMEKKLKKEGDIPKLENESFSDEEEKKDDLDLTASTAATAASQKKKGKKGKREDTNAEETTNNLFDRTGDAGAATKKRVVGRQKGTKKSRNLRCPIVCIMGHVDTGKTLILDKLRRTNVQANEAGGITQQIGATYFPPTQLQKHLDQMNGREDLELELPGFLVIDTPGHESFTNLRSRGSSLCDLAVLVVDIMHGLEPQTLESIKMLVSKNTPFCIALNKVDRLNQWKSKNHANTRDTLEQQNANAQKHFEDQLAKTRLAFNERGFNVELYWLNESVEDTLSLVPTSAITGEGLSDLITNLVKMGQTTEREKLTERDVFECTVLEVKVIEGHGTTIDVVLVNGLLKAGDTIVISGLNGPIRTTIRALLTPQPMKEMRVKGEYIRHEKIKGAMGIKISAPGLEAAIAGSELFRCNTEEEVQDALAEIEGDLVDILEKYVDKT